MSGKRIKKKHSKLAQITAKKSGVADEPSIRPHVNPQKEGGSGPDATDGFRHLHPCCPDPEEEPGPLPESQVHRLTSAVLAELKVLRPNLNLNYWKKFTYEFLRSDASQVLVNPARAGSGKSTFIRAFLRVLARGYETGDPLVTGLGGVLLVLQKVEELNSLAEEINGLVPEAGDPPMVALQSLTLSGKKYQLCRNREANSFRDCPDCAYAAECPLQLSGQTGRRAYFLGVTQVRFAGMRQNGGLEDALLYRMTEDGRRIRRRFILFDEKPELDQIAALDLRGLNALSNELEELSARRGMRDRQISVLQERLHYLGFRPYQKLRRETVLPLPDGRTEEELAGFCKLEDGEPEQMEALQNTLVKTLGQSSGALQACLPVLSALHRGEDCLFSKVSGFRVCWSEDGLACLRGHQALIFDATADVDGDYLYHPRLKRLSPPPLPDMPYVTFHRFDHRKLNLSRTAVDTKAWLPDGMSALVEEILQTYPGKTFLCAYKKDTARLADSLSGKARAQLAWMPDPDRPGAQILPYFGGTNGSNLFRDCTNVILLGYPRLSPGVYLERCWAAWKEGGVGEAIRRVQLNMQDEAHPWRDGLRCLPMVADYEAHHLASRLEQEIYRCKLRDPAVRDDIHIFLFAPPGEVWKLLHRRFPGSRVDVIQELPDCIRRARAERQQYRGRPTALARVMHFLEEWDGAPVRVAEVREQLEISPSAWKELMKQPQLRRELDECGVLRTGGGRHATWSRPGGDVLPA